MHPSYAARPAGSYGGFACAALLAIVCPTGLSFEPKRRLRAVRGWWCAVAARFHRAPTSMKQAGDEPGLRRALRALLELVTHLASGEHPVADSLWPSLSISSTNPHLAGETPR